LKVKPFVVLTPETAVPVHNFRETLTCFTKRAWGAYFRGSPAKWSTRDGEVVVKALLEAGLSLNAAALMAHNQYPCDCR